MVVSRNTLAMMALFVFCYVGFSSYLLLMRPERRAEASRVSTNMLTPVATQSFNAGSISSTASADADALQTISPDRVEKWLADAAGDDAKARAAAIVALASVPPAQAVPALQKVLNAGDPVVDRPLALNSLHTLALQQGDADESIRGVLRQAIYHGDDEATTRAAQAVLDDVENKIEQPAPGASH